MAFGGGIRFVFRGEGVGWIESVRDDEGLGWSPS